MEFFPFWVIADCKKVKMLARRLEQRATWQMPRAVAAEHVKELDRTLPFKPRLTDRLFQKRL